MWRGRKCKVTATPQEDGVIKSDLLAFENRKQVKCVVSKDLCESTDDVFNETSSAQESVYLCGA